jgi:hypothetical protein
MMLDIERPTFPESPDRLPRLGRLLSDAGGRDRLEITMFASGIAGVGDGPSCRA